MFKVLAASGIILALLAMAWQAAHSRAVVIDAFKAPPNLANRGIKGDVVAAGVLDALRNLQDATRSTAQRLNTTTACATDIKIALPQTGTDNLQLTVRGDDIPAKKIADGPNDPDKRTTAAAEYLPMIYLHRGLNAMNRGGFAAAAADFVAANTSTRISPFR